MSPQNEFFIHSPKPACILNELRYKEIPETRARTGSIWVLPLHWKQILLRDKFEEIQVSLNAGHTRQC